MRAILINLRLLALAAGFASPVFAGDVMTAPPSPPVSPSDIDSSSKATFARSFAIGNLKGQLGETVLRGFVSQAGSGKIQQMAGNGVAMSWVCYDVGGDRVWLSLTSGKGAAVIDTMTVKVRETGASSCTVLPQGTATIDGAIRLGMSQTDLVARLGKPSKQRADWLVFRTGAAKGSVQTLIVRIDNGKVAFIEASNTSTD